MILKPTAEQSIALADMRHNPHVLSYMQDALEKTKDRLVTVTDPDVFRTLQGQAHAYQEMIHLITGQPRGKR